MDFPNGPYHPGALHAIIATGQQSSVDIDNVQFKATLPGMLHNDFMGPCAMTLLMLGAAGYPPGTWPH
jgi:hypothetical protein